MKKPLFIFLPCLLIVAVSCNNAQKNTTATQQNQDTTAAVHKTAKQVNYDSLRLANVQREKKRVEIITDEKQRNIALEIAQDPVRAYAYGYYISSSMEGKDAKPIGFEKCSIKYRVPPKRLFYYISDNSGAFKNIGMDGITTEFQIYMPTYNKGNHLHINDFEKYMKNELSKAKVGKSFTDKSGNVSLIHDKNLSLTTVFGIKGLCATLIWENDYQYGITDNYTSYKDGVMYKSRMRTYIDKDQVTFEQLKGRRYYFKKLIDKMMATAEATYTLIPD